MGSGARRRTAPVSYRPTAALRTMARRVLREATTILPARKPPASADARAKPDADSRGRVRPRTGTA